MSNDEARLLEGEIRRVFGKCVLGSGSKGVDRQRSVKRALRRLVLAGCDLLQTAQVREVETRLQVVELNCRGYLQRLCFKPWKAQWSASGPARVAALTELRRGREAVQCAAAAAFKRGTMSNLGRFIAGVRMVHEARKERVLIELRLPGHDPRAAALWCIKAAVRVARWRRLRAGEAYERSRGWVRLTTARPAPRAPVVVQLWRVALPDFALPPRAAVSAACSSLEGVVVPGAFKSCGGCGGAVPAVRTDALRSACAQQALWPQAPCGAARQSRGERSCQAAGTYNPRSSRNLMGHVRLFSRKKLESHESRLCIRAYAWHSII